MENVKKNYIVSKRNELVNAKYELSLQEQRLILVLVSLVDSRKDRKFYEYEMRVSEFADLLGIENTNHTYMRKITKQLMEKVVEIEDDRTVLQVHWLTSAKYFKDEGKVRLELHRELMPYLLQLKKQFTSYALSNVLQMKSKYSLRLYEIFKANQFKRTFEIEVDLLRKKLKCESYTRFSNFNQKVLTPAIEEINQQTDIIVLWDSIKNGRRIEKLRFEIADKRQIDRELFDEES